MNTYLRHAAFFTPALWFQARRLLVVTDGRLVVDGGRFQKGGLILLKILSDEVHSI